jgi:amino acid transporter
MKQRIADFLRKYTRELIVTAIVLVSLVVMGVMTNFVVSAVCFTYFMAGILYLRYGMKDWLARRFVSVPNWHKDALIWGGVIAFVLAAVFIAPRIPARGWVAIGVAMGIVLFLAVFALVIVFLTKRTLQPRVQQNEGGEENSSQNVPFPRRGGNQPGRKQSIRRSSAR